MYELAAAGIISPDPPLRLSASLYSDMGMFLIPNAGVAAPYDLPPETPGQPVFGENCYTHISFVKREGGLVITF